MSTEFICHYCHGPLRSDATGEVCPQCNKPWTPKADPAALPYKTVLLNRYEIQKELGAGGFGITYLAKDLELDRSVVIKEFFPKIIVSRHPGEICISVDETKHKDHLQLGIKRFLDEAKLLAKFDHPNIGKIQFSFRENETAYFVMDYRPGMTLLELALEKSSEGMSITELFPIMVSILTGLVEVHKTGTIHRDVKPSNIFLPYSGEPFLIDFGNARLYAKGSLSQFFSPGYAPIEQYSTNLKNRRQGPWTDVYSCAATMYACLQSQVSEKGILKYPLPAPDRAGSKKLPDISNVSKTEIPKHVAKVINIGLSLNANRRQQDAGTFLKELQAAMKRSKEIQPEPPPPPPPPPIAAEYELYCIAGEYEGESVPLSSDPIIIGRDPKTANIILNDRAITRQHCQIQVKDAKVIVHDFSLNGTYVNDSGRLAKGKPAVIGAGDYLNLAGVVVFEVVPGASNRRRKKEKRFLIGRIWDFFAFIFGSRKKETGKK